ncbi:MAG: hypothetical protein VX644_14650 [Planctomycetota bacterium]|nr:hypothetical protein [Planctomycetota bacterium]
MCKPMNRLIAWPLLACLVISLIGADTLHYRLCHHHPTDKGKSAGCTLHAHQDGVLHTHGAEDPASDPVPTDPLSEDCLVCQVLSNDAPEVSSFLTLYQGNLVVDLTVGELCQRPGKPRRCALSRGPPRVSISL